MFDDVKCCYSAVTLFVVETVSLLRMF